MNVATLQRQLREVERQLAETDDRIRNQQALLEVLKLSGRDTEDAQRLLSAMLRHRKIYEQHRAKIAASLHRFDG